MTRNPSVDEAFPGPPAGESGPPSESDLRAEIIADIDRTMLRLELGSAHRLRALGEHLELTGNELLVLAELLVRPRGLNPAALADIVGVSAGGITGIVDRLRTRGLAGRAHDPADGRRVILVATPAARALWTDRADRAGGSAPVDGSGTAFLLGELDLRQVRGVARFVGLAADRAYRQTRQLRARTAQAAAHAARTARTASR